MKEGNKNNRASSWLCALCEEALTESTVQVQYLGYTFSITMLACPKCGMAMVTEEIATGKMAEAEQILEDK